MAGRGRAAAGCPRLVWLRVVKDRAAFRGHLLRLAELPAVRAIVSHHETIVGDVGAALRTAAASV